MGVLGRLGLPNTPSIYTSPRQIPMSQWLSSNIKGQLRKAKAELPDSGNRQ